MTSLDPKLVVTAEWLKKELDNKNPDIRVLDVTWYSAKDAKEDYLKAHIPGAVYFNIFDGAQHTDSFPRNLPPKEVFEANARSAGINNNSEVVVYDNTGQGGFFVGARAWWTFGVFGFGNVSVLNGGMNQWTGKGFPTTTEVPEVQPGNFTVNCCDGLRITVDHMVGNLTSKDFQVVDTRPLDAYKGKKENPLSGHYPGAVSMPMAPTFLDPEQKQLKSPEELKEVFSAAGIDVNKPLATMCNGGMSSCTALLSASLLGNRCGAVYHGGFSEWKNTHPKNIDQSQ